MTTEYTPTTEDVIRGFIAPAYKIMPQQDGESFSEYLSRMSMQSMEHQIASEAAIRRWLAEHDREVGAKALEGFASELCDRNVEYALTDEARHFATVYGRQARERAGMIREGRA
jgi:hypothetical protein